MWRHLDISSLRLFRSPLFFDVNMWNFSARHKLHLSDPQLRTLVVWTVFQLTVWFILSFFRAHIFFESSVLFEYFLLRKDDICVLYRVLESPSQRPMYLKLSVSVFTSAS